jgi:hypothetical protein
VDDAAKQPDCQPTPELLGEEGPSDLATAVLLLVASYDGRFAPEGSGAEHGVERLFDRGLLKQQSTGTDEYLAAMTDEGEALVYRVLESFPGELGPEVDRYPNEEGPTDA